MSLNDGQGRKHDYLRISVTDRCNLRCVYCMGEEGIEQTSHDSILSYEEIHRVVLAGAELGISKIRITGGEPLVRKDLVKLIRLISETPGIEDLAMTTNAQLLPRFAASLKEAGLNRVNVSLDSLNPDKYKKITRCGELKGAMAGIEAALAHGLQPVKLNTVLMRGVNDNEILDFLMLAKEKPLHIRFIEYMPIGGHDQSYHDHYLPLSFVEKTAAKAGLPLSPVPLPGGAGPAEAYTIPEGKGSIGLIHPISKHFCSSCNRLRLTSEGTLKACLYWQDEKSVRPALGNKKALQDLIRAVLKSKPAEHQMTADGNCGRVEPGRMRGMSQTGG
ncbi:MAG: GTP 3',8-cyclase MoaA [Bacillota bacterium]